MMMMWTPSRKRCGAGMWAGGWHDIESSTNGRQGAGNGTLLLPGDAGWVALGNGGLPLSPDVRVFYEHVGLLYALHAHPRQEPEQSAVGD
jgi:hypothetical protein